MTISEYTLQLCRFPWPTRLHKFRNLWHSFGEGVSCKSSTLAIASGVLPDSSLGASLGDDPQGCRTTTRDTARVGQARAGGCLLCLRYLTPHPLPLEESLLRDAGGHPAALAARSYAPKRKHTPTTDLRLIAEIRQLRSCSPHLGKDKLHVLLVPSASTIGRIIARAPDKMRHAPARLDS